jgi:hypothetical protein
MKLRLAVLGLTMILGDPALAQSGISNQRDMYGNLVRDGGAGSQRGVNQSVPNNGSIRNTPNPSPTNPGPPSKIQSINRLGGGTN